MRIGLLCYCLLAFATSPCCAQKDSLWLELLANQPVRFSHGLDLSGCLQFRHYPGDDETKYDVSEFYLHPAIIDELEILPEKRTLIETAFEDMQNDLKDRVLHLSKISSADELKFELAKLDEYKRGLNDELLKRISNALTGSQKSRLRQIQLRFLIHHNGFYQTLNDERVREVLGTPSLDKVQFEKRQGELFKEIVEKNRTLAKDAFGSWLHDFDDEKHQLFEDHWGRIFKTSNGSQQLIFQLDSGLKPTKFEPENLFDIWQNWPRIRHDAAGCCVIEKPSDSKSNYKRTSFSKLQWLQSFVSSEHFQREIEFADEQIADFKKLAAEFFKRKMVFNNEVGKHFGIEPFARRHRSEDGILEEWFVYTLTTPEQLEMFDRAVAQTADEYYEKYFDVFLPHQKKLLEVVLENMNTRLQGPLAELLWGNVGIVLELTDEEKKSLAKKADDSREKLISESKEIYDDTMEQLIALVPANDRQKFRACLGKSFETLYPNLDGFAYALASNSGTNDEDSDE